MPYHYSRPSRESEPTALPDLEVWRDRIANVSCSCGEYDVPARYAEDGMGCPSECGRTIAVDAIEPTKRFGWFYWFCFPGCLPEGDARGPFETEDAALADARDGIEDEDDDDSES